MTTEEKVVRILENYRDDIVSTNERGTVNDQAVILTQSTQAILTLIKPMSRDKLTHIINLKVRDLTCKRRIFDLKAQEELADAIFAVWEKGLK